MPAASAAALPSFAPVAAASSTAGKHLAQGSHAGWTRDSAPFLLLPGSLAREHCRAGQCAGKQGFVSPRLLPHLPPHMPPDGCILLAESR